MNCKKEAEKEIPNIINNNINNNINNINNNYNDNINNKEDLLQEESEIYFEKLKEKVFLFLQNEPDEETKNHQISTYFCESVESNITSLDSLKYLCTIIEPKIISEFRMKISLNYWSAFHIACKSNDSTEIIDYLLSIGFDINELILDYKVEENITKRQKTLFYDEDEKYKNGFFVALEWDRSLNFLQHIINKGIDIHRYFGGYNSFLYLLMCFDGINVNLLLKKLKLLVENGVEFEATQLRGIGINAFHIYLYLINKHYWNDELKNYTKNFNIIQGSPLDIFNYFLFLKIDINTKNGYGENILFKTKELNMLKYFVEEGGGDIHCINNDGLNLFLLAAKDGNFERMKYFVEKNVDVNTVDKIFGFNSLFYLVKFHNLNNNINNLNNNIKNENNDNNFELIKYAISVGVNPRIKVKKEIDLFLYSLQYKDFEMIKFIHSIDPSFFNNYHHAAINIYLENPFPFDINVYQFLIENNIDNEYLNNNNNNNNINLNNQENILQNLIRVCFRRNFQPEKLLFINFKKTFNYFLSRGNSINQILQSHFIQYVHTNNEDYFKVIKYLIDKGYNLLSESNNGSVLHNILIFSFILFSEKDINEKNENYLNSKYDETTYQYLLNSNNNNIINNNKNNTIRNNNNKDNINIYWNFIAKFILLKSLEYPHHFNDNLFIHTINNNNNKNNKNNNNNNNNNKIRIEDWKKEFTNRVTYKEEPILMIITNMKKQKKISISPSGHFYAIENELPPVWNGLDYD